MNALYPPIEAYQHGYLDVGDGHEIYYELCGAPAEDREAKAVVFLHGGPGAGCNAQHRQYFDPTKYRIVLFDQRGCGRSRPHARLEANTTQDLVADIEKLRELLGIERWQVFGGSWGSTLALAYAIAHKQRVTELVLRGIFTFRQQEIDWLFKNGSKMLYPDLWEGYLAPLSESERSDIIKSYYRRLTSPDASTRIAAARAWAGYEFGLIALLPNPDLRAEAMADSFAEAIARIECHYMLHRGFLSSDNELLDGAAELTGIPTSIVHGRYDVICPLDNAWQLQRRMPWAELTIVDDAGHSAAEPGIARALVAATDRYTRI